jgi:hypothetical protein
METDPTPPATKNLSKYVLQLYFVTPIRSYAIYLVARKDANSLPLYQYFEQGSTLFPTSNLNNWGRFPHITVFGFVDETQVNIEDVKRSLISIPYQNKNWHINSNGLLPQITSAHWFIPFDSSMIIKLQDKITSIAPTFTQKRKKELHLTMWVDNKSTSDPAWLAFVDKISWIKGVFTQQNGWQVEINKLNWDLLIVSKTGDSISQLGIEFLIPFYDL